MTDEERRVPVQPGPYLVPEDHPARVAWEAENGPVRGPGTISWAEHERAWVVYNRPMSPWPEPSAEAISRCGGFRWGQLVDFLGHEPETWRPR